jgi:membrane-bound acyltransferase YfiQ involved in biofilm formation
LGFDFFGFLEKIAENRSLPRKYGESITVLHQFYVFKNSSQSEKRWKKTAF